MKGRGKRGPKKGIRKTVHDLWKEKGMWEIDEKYLMTEIRMIKSKGWVTNIELIREKYKMKVEMR